MISQTRSELYKLSRSIIVLIVIFVLIIANIFISTRPTDDEPIMSSSEFVRTYEIYSLDLVKSYLHMKDSEATDLAELFFETHPNQFRYVLHRNLGMLIITTVFAAYYIGMEYKSRSFNNALYVGRSRSTVYFSKVIAYYITAAVISIITVLAITQFCASRVFTQLPAEYVWRCILMYVLLDLGIMSVPLLFVFLFRSPVISGIASLIYSFIMLSSGPARDGFFSFEPNRLKMLPDMWLQNTSSELIMKGLAVPAAFIVVCVLLGWLSFSKTQFK